MPSWNVGTHVSLYKENKKGSLYDNFTRIKSTVAKCERRTETCLGLRQQAYVNDYRHHYCPNVYLNKINWLGQ